MKDYTLHKQKRREEPRINLKTLWGPSVNPVLNIDEKILNFRKKNFLDPCQLFKVSKFSYFYIFFIYFYIFLEPASQALLHNT